LPATHPIVVCAPTGAVEQAVLLESLASHGYVVISFPHKGSPFGGMHRTAVDSGSARDAAMAREIERAIDAAARSGYGDSTRVAVIAGGSAVPGAILLQARTGRLSALIRKEGRLPGLRRRSAAVNNIGFRVGEGADAPADFSERWQIPVLNWQLADSSFTRGILDTFVHAERIHVDARMGHPNSESMRRLVYPRDTIASLGNDVLGAYIQHFLAYVFHGSAPASEFLGRTPEANGVLAGLLSVERIPPRAP
jgi:hypothetical protein